LNTYLGGTVVNGGTLWLSTLTSVAAGGAITVNDGGTLAVTAAGVSQLTPSTLTLGSGANAATNSFQAISSTSTAPIHATNLVLNGATTVNIQSGNLQVGQTYPLIAYDNPASGGGSVVLGSLPPLIQGTLNDSGSLISLTVTNLVAETWSGAVNGVWDTVAVNWKTNGIATTYIAGSQVRFDDTATGTTSITNIASVSPSSITVTNSSKAYSFAGGAIGGLGSLTKSGNGTVTLDVTLTNTYSGGTFLNGGTLAINADANLGAAAALGLNSGTFSALGTLTLNSGRTVTVGPASGFGSATVNVAGTNTLTVNNAINNNGSGTGALVKTGTGTLALGVNNSYSGGTTINAGAVLLPNGSTNSFGTGTLNLNSNVTLVVKPGNGTSWDSANSVYIGNNVVVQAGQTNLIDNSQSSFGNLWVGGDSGLWSGSGTVRFQNSGPFAVTSVLWNGNPLQTFNGTINIGSTNSGFRMFNGIAYNSSSGGGTGTSVSTFDAQNVAWVLGDVGYSASQVQDVNCALVRMGSIAASNPNTTIRGNSTTAVTFEVGALNTSTTFAGTINDWNSATPAITHLTKVGSGTLSLTGINTYTGDTTVNAGTLELAQATLATNSTVTLASGAVLKLDFNTTNIVTGLVLNGISQTPGVYNSTTASPYITGAGSLVIPSAAPTGPAQLTNSYSTGVLSLSWPAGEGWRLQMQTNSLSKGLGTNWVYITDGSISSTNIAVDPTKPASFFRLTYP
jgi:fibronectin-binding autotransporter adhesin